MIKSYILGVMGPQERRTTPMPEPDPQSRIVRVPNRDNAALEASGLPIELVEGTVVEGVDPMPGEASPDQKSEQPIDDLNLDEMLADVGIGPQRITKSINQGRGQRRYPTN